MQAVLAVMVGLMLLPPVVAQPLVEGWVRRSSGQPVEAAQVIVSDWTDLPRGKALGAIRRLTHSATGDWGPSWSPDGRHIVFNSYRDGNNEIYVMGSDGSNPRRLTHNEADDRLPSWSPDGTKIAFMSWRDGNAEIYVMDSDGTNPRRLTHNEADDWDPSWSPDGRHIAFESNRDGNDEIYVMDSDGNNPRRLTYRAFAHHSSWSPDGRHIAFRSGRHGSVFQPNSEIYVMDSDGNNPRRLTNHSARDFSPTWSPDGWHIAFVSGRDGNYEIYVMDSDGDNPRRLTSHRADDSEPTWSPDGRQIAFVSQRDGNYEIYVMEMLLSSPKIVLESQTIDDDSFGWSEGNANGVVEVGEQITFTVILRNEGDIEAENVKGTLSAENRSSESIIVDGEVDYGNIGVGRSGSGDPFGHLLDLEDPQRFKLKIPSILTSQDATFTLTVTADNGGPWTIPITVPISNPANIGIAFPDDLISEEAFGTHSTYFILKVQYPTLTGIPATEAYYEKCEIILHIPDGTQAFMSPIQTQGEKAAELLGRVVISIGELLLKKAALLIDIIKFFERSRDMREHELKIELPGFATPGHPDIAIEYMVLLQNETRTLNSLDITIKQTYHLGGLGESPQRDEVHKKSRWYFGKGWAAARAAHPLALSDYPPFQLLPLEAQQYLLRQFSAFETAEASRIPAKTVVAHNYPNPFNPETWISYQLAESSEVTVSIYSVDGKLVRRLALGYQTAGVYQGKSRAAYWDGRNEFGEHVASGVYFYTFVAGNFSAAGKMLMMK